MARLSKNPHGFDTAKAFANEGLKLVALTLILATAWVTLDLVVDDDGGALIAPVTARLSDALN